MESRVRLLVVVALLCGLAGCGSGTPYPMQKINGTIEYDDGSPIPATRIELRFVPQVAAKDAKTQPKMGICEVNVEDGSFSTISTYEYGDGVVRGEHKVLAMAMDERNAITDAIPASYQGEASTALTVNTDDAPWKLVIPKPSARNAD